MKAAGKLRPLLGSTNLLMVLAMLLIGVANILWAERLTVNGGLGWDGLLYGTWAKDFYRHVFAEGVSEYYAQRVLPSALVHYGTRIVLSPFLGAARTGAILDDNRNIILAFDIYNLILLLVSVYVWGLIAGELKVSDRGRWLGFLLLFVNFAILKNNFYHPTLTDTTAFALGILAFYFFLTGRPVGLLCVLAAGAFTWPTLAYMVALLYVFPREPGSPTRQSRDAQGTAPEPPRAPARGLNVYAAAGVALFMLLALLYLVTRNFEARLQELAGVMRIDLRLLYVSIVAVVVYLFAGLKPALADARLFDPRGLLRAVRWDRAAVFAVLFVLLRVGVKLLAANVEMGGTDTRQFIRYTFLASLCEPLIFLVAHAVWFGPAVVMLLLLWGPFCEEAGRYGVGFRMLLILTFLLSINPQSRFMINVLPAFVMLLAAMLDRAGLGRRALAGWALLSLVYSKVWYTFNTGPQVYDGIESLLRFPLQHYFANSGSWMSTRMYYIQGAAVALTAVLLYAAYRRGGARGRAGRLA